MQVDTLAPAPQEGSLQQLQAILEHVPAFVSYVGRDRRYRFVSMHYERYFGHPRHLIIGREMREILGEDAWQHVGPALDSAIGGEVSRFELQFPVTGVGVRWVQGTFTPDTDEHGSVRGVVVFVNDITDQKRHERELEDKDAFYRSIFESPGVANIEADLAAGRIMRVNRFTCELLGYSEAELLDGRTFFDITHPDDRARNWELIQPLLRGEVQHFRIEKRYLHKDGAAVWVNVTVIALRDATGQPDRLLGTAQDITARVEAEQALRLSEERVRLAVRAAGIGYWKQDPHTGVGTLDEVGAQLFQLGMNPSLEEVFSRIAPEDRERVQQAFYDSFSGERPYHAEFRVRYPDGTERWLMGLGSCQKDSSGALKLLYGVNIDITARKQAKELLKEADRRKDEFLATLAHELRNPLAPISNALQMLPLLEQDPVQLRKAHDMMQRQVSQLKHLIDDLLDVSRISEGKIKLRYERMDLGTVVNSAIESVRPTIDALGHSLHVSLPDTPVLVDGDPGRLTQICGNLVHNAAKYTDKNGHIFVSLAVDGDEVEFRVRDTGLGIPKEMLASIFDPFIQVQRTLDRAQGGLGIGLTLVKKLVALHGGSIEARSEGLGKGSEFIVRLPRHRAADGPEARWNGAEHTAPTVLSSVPHHRVLVVDDSRSSADTLAMMLESLGQETRVAYDGASALGVARDFHPEIVFSDLAMPGMDGLQLARELRRDLGSNATLVAVTGYGQERDRERSAEAGFGCHLVKPVTLRDLNEVVAAQGVSQNWG